MTKQRKANAGEITPVEDLPLYWQGFANALRLMDKQRAESDLGTLQLADGYEQCATELKTSLARAAARPALPTREDIAQTLCHPTKSESIDAILNLFTLSGETSRSPETLAGMIAAVYGSLDAEDCKIVDRQWAKQRGYILPDDGTSSLTSALGKSDADV